MRIPKICGSCGSKKINIKNLAGRDFPWKDFSAVKLNKEFLAAVCDDCDEIFFQAGSGKELDQLLNESLRETVSEYIIQIITKKGWTQKELSSYLDISEVHLSKLKNGKAGIGRTLFRFLESVKNDVDRKVNNYGETIDAVLWKGMVTVTTSMANAQPQFGANGGSYAVAEASYMSNIDDKEECAAESNEHAFAMAA